MIDVSNVSFKYKYKDNVLENVNLKIEENEIVSIIREKWRWKIYFIKFNFRTYKACKWKNYCR